MDTSNPEYPVIRKIVEQAISLGYTVTVYDGEDYPIQDSIDPDAIMAEIGAVDEEHIIIRNDRAKRLGSVFLVHEYQNPSPEEVICDYSVNLAEKHGLTSLDWEG